MLNFGLLGRAGKGSVCILQGTNYTKYGSEESTNGVVRSDPRYD